MLDFKLRENTANRKVCAERGDLWVQLASVWGLEAPLSLLNEFSSDEDWCKTAGTRKKLRFE